MKSLICMLYVLLLAIAAGCSEKKRSPRTEEGEEKKDSATSPGEIRLSPEKASATVQVGGKVYCGVRIGEKIFTSRHPYVGTDFSGLKVQVNGRAVGSVKHEGNPESDKLLYYLFEAAQKGTYSIKVTSHGVRRSGDDDNTVRTPVLFQTATYEVTVQ